MRLINKISKSIAFRSILIIVTLLIVYSAVSGIMGYRATSQSLYDQYTEDAFQVANAAAFVIDGDSLDEMIEGGEDSELYRRITIRLPFSFPPSAGRASIRPMNSAMSEPRPMTSIS